MTPTDGAGAVPAGGGSSLPLSGGPGIDPAGITTGARGASLKRGALHRVKRGLDRASAHGRSKSRGRAPKGERAPSRPPRKRGGEEKGARRIRRCGPRFAPSGALPPLIFLEANTSCRSLPKLGCGCIARTRSLSSPLAGEDRSRAARSGEGSGIPAAVGSHPARRFAARHPLPQGEREQRAAREQKMRKQQCQQHATKNRTIVPTPRNG